jgi:hypothetical protein
MPERPEHPADRPTPAALPSDAAPPELRCDPLSAMTARFNLPFRWFARRYFRHFRLDEETLAQLRGLEERGSVVYVMRYASRLDYFLFNTLFRREGLRLSGFANGIRFYYYRPLLEAVRSFLRGRRIARQTGDGERIRGWIRELVLGGGSSFLFLRTARLRGRGRRRASREGQAELDLLEEVVRVVWRSERPVHVVPLAIFRLLHHLSRSGCEGGRPDRPGRLRPGPPRSGRARRGAHGAAFDPELPLPRGEGGGGPDPAPAPRGAGDRGG